MSDRLRRPAVSSPPDGGSDTAIVLAALSTWRRIDWRFLLPPGSVRTAAYVGKAPEEEIRVLRESGVHVASDLPHNGSADAVIIVNPSEEALGAAIAASRPGGWVLVRLGSVRPGPWSRMAQGSTRHWQRRLSACGLTAPQAFWHAPTEQRSSYIVALTDRPALREMLSRYHGVRWGLAKSVAARFLNSLGVVEVLARDVTVLARRATDPAPTAGAPVDVGSGAFGGPAAGKVSSGGTSTLLITPWFEASRHVVRISMDGRTGALIRVTKLPRRPRDVTGIRREADALRAVVRHTDKLAGQLPEFLRLEDGATPFLVETAVAGTGAGPDLVRARPDSVLRAGFQFISRLPHTGRTRHEVGWFTRLLDTPLRHVAQSVPMGPAIVDLVGRTLDLLAPLASADLPLVFEHGDLGYPNVLLRPDGRLAALDWERSEPHGLPGHDLCFFLQYVAESRRSAFVLPQQLKAFDEAFVGARAWTGPWFRRYLAALEVDQDMAPFLVLASWARSSAGLLERVAPVVEVDSGSPDRCLTGAPLAAAFASDRDFALWRHAVTRFPDLSR
jgi:aminoglycoside phosphotransferase (APT) family kinase protein